MAVIPLNPTGAKRAAEAALLAPLFLPSVKTHPTSTQTSPQYVAATQARSAAPPNTTIDDIAYHTPAAAVFNYKMYESTKRAAGAALLVPSPSAKTPAQKRDVRSHPQPATPPIQEPATTAQKTSSTHPLRRCVFVILTQHPRPRRTNTGERRPTRQTNPTNGNESKPQCKPRTNPTPASAGVVIFMIFF
ncbi:hypothetical protein BS47DRAFT_1360847 [Hydnum rufescens UP504]|uniref:Uncharacterized protein n=1 Tax=Hydnum rufescens UP504 TaxID=1448309 RepID=A0A9P6B0S6_9AGAM|nr:hypothetical protein BS47DRAFT_1360847 [Hydnum rufescens UP504]